VRNNQNDQLANSYSSNNALLPLLLPCPLSMPLQIAGMGVVLVLVVKPRRLTVAASVWAAHGKQP
jgi:hypothetical protein